MGADSGDRRAFFAADFGEACPPLSATTASQQFDTDGVALQPGRWLLQCIPSADTVVAWVKLGKHGVANTAVIPTTAKLAKTQPMNQKSGILALEFVVFEGYNDAAPAVILSAGTATMLLSRVSR